MLCSSVDDGKYEKVTCRDKKIAAIANEMTAKSLEILFIGEFLYSMTHLEWAHLPSTQQVLSKIQ